MTHCPKASGQRRPSASTPGKRWCCRATTTLILMMMLPTKQVSGEFLYNMMKGWQDYKEECLRKLKVEREATRGVYCNGTFDKVVCWPHSPPGTVSVPCPSYLPIVHEGGPGGYTYRHCTNNGTWRTHQNSTNIWRNFSECSMNHTNKRFEENEKGLTLQLLLKICYTVGYSVSLGTLVVALCILLMFRKLHCTRNYIHMNLFASFILKALAVLVKDIAHITPKAIIHENGSVFAIRPEVLPSCRMVIISLHYFIGANFFWLLVEGIYLYTTIVTMVLSERRMLLRYIAIGWLCPFLFIIPWVIARAYLENEGCWATNGSTAIWYIIKGPILLCIFVNFIVHIRILKLLHVKLRAQQLKFTDYKYRFAKATLILIPLLGTHEILFTFVSDEHIKGLTRHILLFIQLTMSSLQGFVVAYLYCFTNGEVKTELRKQWNLFLLQYFPCKSCVFGNKVKYKTQATKKPKKTLFTHNGACQNGQKKSKIQLLQATTNVADDRDPKNSAPVQYFARGSVSESSDGGLTMETIEETVEESEI